MTRQEAIEVLKHTIAYESGFAEAKQMAIEALEKEPSEDCISREYILGEAFMSDEYNRETQSFDLPVVSVSDIEDAPSVVPSCQKNRQVEREEGEWELASDNDGEYGVCSLCGNDADFTHYGKAYHYCPNCGAKMKGAEDGWISGSAITTTAEEDKE